MLRIIALFMMLPLGGALLRSVKKASESSLSMRDELIEFLSYLEGRVRSSLKPLTDAVEEYGCSAHLRSMLTSPRELRQAEGAKLLTEEDIKILEGLLQGYGEMEYSRQAEAIAEAVRGLSRISEAERARAEKDGRVYPILALGIAAGIFILII